MLINSEQNIYKKRFLSGILIVTGISILLDIPVSIHQGWINKVVIQVIAAIVFFFAVYYLKKNEGSYLPIAFTVITFALIMSVSFTFMEDRQSLYWVLMIPPATLFILSLKYGILWISLSYVFLVPALLLQIYKNNISVADTINFIMGYSFSFFSAYYIEKSRFSIEENLNIAKEKAEKSEYFKSMFLANMSHEIRTPLNAIIGFSSLIETRDLSEDNRLFVNNIINSSNHLVALVNDVLDFSKIESGNLELHETVFSLKDLTESVKDITTILIQNQGKNIKYTLLQADDIAPYIIADDKRIKQILYNLVSNAVKFTEAGEITLEIALPDNETIEFSVTDSGIGIDPEQQQNIFHSFVQADSSISRKYGGTGLGLSISKKLAELMKGDIRLESRTKNIKGAKFSFTMPYLSAQTIVTKFNSVEETTSARTYKILLVEDNDINQLLATKLLKKLGYEVTVVGNGKDAIDILESGNLIDLVLMDIQMPVMDGIEATTIIRNNEKKKQMKRMPIIALSAGAFDNDKKIACDAGCDDYIAKPIDTKILSDTLLKYLQGLKSNL